MLSLLQHITVAELAGGVAARYAGRLLADLGATVGIHEGEDAVGGRLSTFLDANKALRPGKSASFTRAEIADIVEGADAVLIDEAGGPAAEIVLAAAATLPGRVVVHCSFYGLASPNRGLCDDELFLAALSGIASVTPEEFEDRDNERPMQLYGRQGSMLGGLTAAVAVLQAIRLARKTGQTQFIDLSVLDALNSVPLISQAAGFAGAKLPTPPSARPLTVPRGFLRCADGWVYTQGGDDNWPAWAEAIGRPEWRERPWSEPPYREERWPAIEPEITAWLMANTAEHVYRTCQALGVTVFPVNSISQVLGNPQMVHRDIVETVMTPRGEQLRAIRTPIRLAETTP